MSVTVSVTTPMQNELVNYYLVSSPNTLALCGCLLNASVACITKHCGCNSECREENAYVLPFMIDGSVQTYVT